MKSAESIEPGSFEVENHYYPRVLNAHLHPVVKFFNTLGNARLAQRYCHLHPEVREGRVTELLTTRPRHFRWAGADLFLATNERGLRRTVVVETNSSPSGQKSMPFADDSPQSGYRKLMETSFLPMLKRRGLPSGGVAVLSDKNPMETRGYAAVLADLIGAPVWWVPWSIDDPDPPARFVDGVLQVRDAQSLWHPIRGAFKYVTQKPWSRIPPVTRTLIYNSSLVCLAGGRNKLMAAKAYDFLNADLAPDQLEIHTPETIWDVAKQEVPLWVERMGGVAVVKVPYSNAGQGVYTITNSEELEAFMSAEHAYELFIVQGLVGNAGWSSQTRDGRLYHVGTTPDRRGKIFAADLRFMVGVSPEGFFPLAIYARRARTALASTIETGRSSWDMLGTNLSRKLEDGTWTTEPERLLLMDSRDFNRLGVGLDDLIEAYLQTVMAVTAIDRMCTRLVNTKNVFRRKMFGHLNPDDVLAAEICR
ncbi:MAG: hypothetical protein ACI9WU_001000 [Myxococcota bacterium]|jgi:hypothetical protein